MKKIILVIFIVFIKTYGYSQNKLSVEVLTGIGINKEISLINENIEDYFALSSQVNLNYKFKLLKEISLETGIGIQSFFTKGNVGIIKFNSENLRLNLPFIISLPILKNIDIGTGLLITNNKDFDDIDFRKSNNIRNSILFKINYNLKKNFSLLLTTSHNLSKIPEAFFINQPRTGISFGLSYKLL